MAARRALSLIALVSALLIAGLFAVWTWAAAVAGEKPLFVASLGGVVLIAFAFALRSAKAALSTLGEREDPALEPLGPADSWDPRLAMLGDDRGPRRDREPAGCPWCGEPLARAAERCGSCGQRL